MTKINNQKTKTKTSKNKAREPTTMWRSLMLTHTQWSEHFTVHSKTSHALWVTSV